MGNKTLGYEIRYRKQDSGVILNAARYLKDGKICFGIPEYKVNGEWVGRADVPERRKFLSNMHSSKKGFLMYIKRKTVEKDLEWKKKGRYITGENEFEEKKRGSYDKVQAHFDEQVERYGYQCPITLVPFTTIRKMRKGMSGREKILSNISPDRFFSHIHYTKQNTLFTSAGWNLKKGASGLEEIKFFFKKEFAERYKKILFERFPDQEYET